METLTLPAFLFDAAAKSLARSSWDACVGRILREDAAIRVHRYLIIMGYDFNTRGNIQSCPREVDHWDSWRIWLLFEDGRRPISPNPN